MLTLKQNNSENKESIDDQWMAYNPVIGGSIHVDRPKNSLQF
jgi:hypothetical protein